MVKTFSLSAADLVRDLGEDIVFGVFHPKERLTEEDLIARFGLKRHVVREALTQLDLMGLVVRVPNRGAYVRELTPQEVIEIYEVREILEVAAALRTPIPAPKKVIEGLRVIQDQHSQAIANHDLRSVFPIEYSISSRAVFGLPECEVGPKHHGIRTTGSLDPGDQIRRAGTFTKSRTRPSADHQSDGRKEPGRFGGSRSQPPPGLSRRVPSGLCSSTWNWSYGLPGKK